jgi:uncharacterized protein YraI
MEASMSKLWHLLLSIIFVVAVPAVALAAQGHATTDVNMRAGPGTEYPVVDLIPADAHIDIHGCLSDGAWCDVSWKGERGWVDSSYLDYFHNNRYVYLPEYIDNIDVPIAVFSLGTYWNDYYVGEPWYGKLGYWRSFLRSRGRYGYFTRAPRQRFVRDVLPHGRVGRVGAVPPHQAMTGEHRAGPVLPGGPLIHGERAAAMAHAHGALRPEGHGAFQPRIAGRFAGRVGKRIGAPLAASHFAPHFAAPHFAGAGRIGPHAFVAPAAPHFAGPPHVAAAGPHFGGARHNFGGAPHMGFAAPHGGAGGGPRHR